MKNLLLLALLLMTGCREAEENVTVAVSPRQPMDAVLGTVMQGPKSYVFELSGAKWTAVKRFELRGACSAPDLAPDGDTVAVGYDRGDEKGVVVYSRRTGHMRKIFTEVAPGAVNFSADGKQLLIAAATSNRPYSFGGTVPTGVIVWRVPLKGPSPLKILAHGFDFVNSVIGLPDGSTLVVGHRDEELYNGLYLVSSDGTRTKRLDTNNLVYRLVSIGSELFAVSHDGDYDYKLYKATIDSGKLALGASVCHLGYQRSLGVSLDKLHVLALVEPLRDGKVLLRKYRVGEQKPSFETSLKTILAR